MTLQINTSVKSPNFNSRPTGTKPLAILIHTTEGRWPTDLQWLSSPASQVSCHYVISPTGTVFQIVDDTKRAWHAGVGTYQGYSDWNNISLGIELSHKQGGTYSTTQKDALWELCTILIAKYGIKQNLIAAHRWVTPDRRSDPTDWTDADFKAWIARLYTSTEPDWAARWGTAQWYFAESGIAQAWRHAWTLGNVLGAAVTDEFSISGGGVVRGFEHGYISWAERTGTVVRRWV